MKVNLKNFLSLSIFILYISQAQQFSLFTEPDIDPMSLLSCDELYSVIFTSLENITEYIDQNIYYLKQKFPICIDLLVKNGRIEALDYYLDELDKRKIDYRTSLSLAINSIKKELEDVNIKYRYQKIEYKNIYPASQWAQSLDNIYIEIKFAHRHDSPGCLEVEDKKIDIKEDSLSFTGTCSLGDDYIRIDYNIKLNKKINVAASVHESGAVGRYRFTLKKAERGFWEKLLADGEEPHLNMKIWYEMKEKYQDELMGYEKDEDDEADKDDKDKDKDDDDNDNDDDTKDKEDIEEKKEEPKKEEPKKEEPKKEETKKEEPKKEEVKKGETKKEEPKKEEVKKEEPKKKEPKKEEVKKEEPKKEEPKKEEVKKEEIKKEEPKKEEVKKEDTKKEEPKKEEPKKENPKKEETKKEEKKKEEIKKEDKKEEKK